MVLCKSGWVEFDWISGVRCISRAVIERLFEVLLGKSCEVGGCNGHDVGGAATVIHIAPHCAFLVSCKRACGMSITHETGVIENMSLVGMVALFLHLRKMHVLAINRNSIRTPALCCNNPMMGMLLRLHDHVL